MSSKYVRAVEKSWKSIESILGAILGKYAVVITADHGGHVRYHGSLMTVKIPKDWKGKNPLVQF